MCSYSGTSSGRTVKKDCLSSTCMDSRNYEHHRHDYDKNGKCACGASR